MGIIAGILLSALCVVSPAEAKEASLDWNLDLESETRAEAFYTIPGLWDALDGLMSESLRASLWASTGALEFRVAGSAGFSDSSGFPPEWSLETMVLTWDAQAWLRLEAGRKPPQPFSSLVFPIADYLGSVSPLTLLEEGLHASLPTRELATATAFLTSGFVRASWAPFHEAPDPILPGSPWFPANKLPGIYAIPDLGLELPFGSLVYELEAKRWDPSGYSVLLEAGLTFGAFDARASAFYGEDPDPCFLRKVLVDDLANYDVSLKPSTGKVPAGALGLTWVHGRASLSLDASIQPFKHYAPLMPDDPSSLIDLLGGYQEATIVPTLDGGADLSFTLPWEGSLLFLEARGRLRLGDEPIEKGYLEKLCAIGLTGDISMLRLQPTLVALMDLTEAEELASPAFALFASLAFKPGDGLGIEVSSPFFFGPKESLLGQFAGRLSLQCLVSVRPL